MCATRASRAAACKTEVDQNPRKQMTNIQLILWMLSGESQREGKAKMITLVQDAKRIRWIKRYTRLRRGLKFGIVSAFSRVES